MGSFPEVLLPSSARAMARLFGGSRLSESRNVLTVYSIRSRWSRLQNHFRILTNGDRRAAPARARPTATLAKETFISNIPARERREAPRARQAKVAALGAAVGGGENLKKGGVLGAGKTILY